MYSDSNFVTAFMVWIGIQDFHPFYHLNNYIGSVFGLKLLLYSHLGGIRRNNLAFTGLTDKRCSVVHKSYLFVFSVVAVYFIKIDTVLMSKVHFSARKAMTLPAACLCRDQMLIFVTDHQSS